MPTTRLVSGLWGGRRAGSFAGRGPASTKGDFNSRIVSGLWAGRITGAFAGKTPETPTTPPSTGGGGGAGGNGGSGRAEWRGRQRGDYPKDFLAELLSRRTTDDNEVVLLVARAWMEFDHDA